MSKSSANVKYTLKLFFCRLLEEAYVMKDPFTLDKNTFLIIKSHCSLCSRAVCVDINCSLFYSKSFSLPCVKESLKAFPLEIQEDMDKRKPQQKSCKKTDTKHKS
ncbi:cysteine-rich DPF motif domain-containing protein 1 [Serinus canaria]|uniref:cysteine-rich DPF motif domain-containing protein 1 n=1 Tax=Serinus canaria TaxID=9135 RepID=UPI0008DB7FF7|nr:cysteine-rich DPF motif domain-containing protein 1 [Serinus canaria]